MPQVYPNAIIDRHSNRTGSPKNIAGGSPRGVQSCPGAKASSLATVGFVSTLNLGGKQKMGAIQTGDYTPTPFFVSITKGKSSREFGMGLYKRSGA